MSASDHAATLADAVTVGVISSVSDTQGDDCGPSCGAGGWIAAAIAALCFGTYGVPIKATLNIEVHPLVLQSYKTIVLFLTCWFVVFAGEDTIRFTRWGILSGFLWVVGGTGGIYGIRNAGMAIAIGTWSSVMVIVNFVWGILIFREPVHSYLESFCAFALLGLGLVGMSKYSSVKKATPSSATIEHEDPRQRGSGGNEEGPEFLPIENTVENDRLNTTGDDEEEGDRTMNRALLARRKNANTDEEVDTIADDGETAEQNDHIAFLHESGDIKPLEPEDLLIHVPYFIGRFTVNKRQLGIALSVFNGLFSGSSLLPLHKAKAEGFGGLAYIPSYGCGAMISNILVWLVFLVINFVRLQRLDHQQRQQTEGQGSAAGNLLADIKRSLETMPPFHFRELWFRGLLAGLLLSVAMFASIVATTYLGQGVGNSLVQSKILISGLWGICWYREISDPQAITKWFLSAGICVISIICLTYERLAAKGT